MAQSRLIFADVIDGTDFEDGSQGAPGPGFPDRRLGSFCRVLTSIIHYQSKWTENRGTRKQLLVSRVATDRFEHMTGQ